MLASMVIQQATACPQIAFSVVCVCVLQLYMYIKCFVALPFQSRALWQKRRGSARVLSSLCWLSVNLVAVHIGCGCLDLGRASSYVVLHLGWDAQRPHTGTSPLRALELWG